MKPTRYLVVVLSVVAFWPWKPDVGISIVALAQTATGAQVSQAEVARMLAGQKSIIVVPTKGKVRHKIEKDDRQFTLPDGTSPAVLFKLPEYVAPYTLSVWSLCNCKGFKKSMLVPSGVFLDGDFKETHRLDEGDLVTNRAEFITRAMKTGAAVEINDQTRTDSYLLIYTRGDLLGKTAERLDLAYGAAMGVTRSANGTLELEARAEKKK